MSAVDSEGQLMRKGAKREEWTTAEERYLVDNAGKVSKRTICRTLRKSSAAVRSKAYRMRQDGIDVRLRCYESRLQPCPRCGQPRSRFDNSGFCRVCELRDDYREARWRQVEAYRILTPEQKEVYDTWDGFTGSEIPPRPSMPDTSHMDRPARARAEERHAIAVEEWQIETLTKLTNATKTRTKRMRRKTGTNPRKNQ